MLYCLYLIINYSLHFICYFYSHYNFLFTWNPILSKIDEEFNFFISNKIESIENLSDNNIITNETKSPKIHISDYEFNQWFTGYSDGESTF